MGVLWALVRKNPLKAGIAVAVLLLLGLSAVLWVQARSAEIDAREARAEAAALRVELDGWKASHAELRAATDAQQAAVLKLVTESAERQARATAAIQTAALLSGQLVDRAQQIMTAQAPPGVDPCLAAQTAFAAELLQERSP